MGMFFEDYDSYDLQSVSEPVSAVLPEVDNYDLQGDTSSDGYGGDNYDMQAPTNGLSNIYFNSEANRVGTGNSLPITSDAMQSSGAGNTSFDGVLKLLGSARQTARDIGIAVGSLEKEVRGAPAAYQQGRVNAASTSPVNGAKLWLSTATMTDKLTVGIGLAGLYFLIARRG